MQPEARKERMRVYSRKLWQERINAGLCPCGEETPEDGAVRCRKCLDKQVQYRLKKDPDKWSKIHRLHIASVVSPHLRNNDKAARRVGITNAAGSVVGYKPLGEIQKAVLARSGIEFDVALGSKPKGIPCKYCGKMLQFKPGRGGSSIRSCRDGCQLGCEHPRCKRKISVDAARKAMRQGRQRLCMQHKQSRKRRTVCKRGHERSGDNLTLDGGCRACIRLMRKCRRSRESQATAA